MKTFKVVAIVVVMIIAWQMIKFWRDINLPPSNDATPVLFEIATGEGVNVISNHLFAKGLIRNQWHWETYVWLLKAEGKLQAGVYELSRFLNAKELTEFFLQGAASRPERLITIIEGRNSRQIAAYLAGLVAVKDEEFLALVEAPAAALIESYEFLEPHQSLEGFLFPDTYRVYHDATAEEIIITMLNNFSVKTEVLRQSNESRDLNFYQRVILASIIEKEVTGQENMAKVADVFLKRLKAGMPLQSDATVNYVTGKKITRPSYDDLAISSPYNTYRHQGLPPTPIGNPGLVSLEAVFKPMPNDYYFFLTTPANEVVFSRTYEEHLNNKAKYYP